MLRELDRFYLEQPEPNQSFMLGLRSFILSYSSEMTEEWKWKLPFFYYKGKPFCYIWKSAKTGKPYLGIVKADLFDHPRLIQENRKKMKVIYFDVKKDIPLKVLSEIFKLAIQHY